MYTRAPSEYLALYDGFNWKHALMSHPTTPFLVGAGYLVLVLALNKFARGLNLNMRLLQAAHNLILCLGSLAMALGTAVEVTRRVRFEGSSRWLFCEAPSTEPVGALWFWSYIYYLSKYYELLDTVLQLLKGRPPPHFMLHVYHHSVVLVMGWGWLEYVQTLSFIGLLFNTSVHVVMYYYYFLRVLGRDVWWKSFVTRFQIVQFCTSAVCGCITLYLVLVEGAQCAGLHSLCLNFMFNMTLLQQFVDVLNSGQKARKKE